MAFVFVTEIKALDPKTGELKTWAGPNVSGISFEHAQAFCDNNGMGYCKVVGRLVRIESFTGGELKIYEHFN